MKHTGINMSNVKASNRAAVLYLLNENNQMSRKDVADALGLTPAAVTKICGDLLNEKAIVECGVQDEEIKAGRKKIMLSLNTKNIYALAVSIEFDSCFIAVCSLDGKVIKSENISIKSNLAPEKYLDIVADNCKKIIDASKVKMKKIIGVGVGIIGSVSNPDGVTVGKYGVWSEGINVRKILEEKLSLPVVVENNVKAFAQAELIFDRENTSDNILFIKWGPRVGSAIIISGEVFSGNDNSAAEIGHYIVHPNGIQCRCGRKGCLETHVSAQAIVDKVREHYGKAETPVLYEKTNGDINAVTFALIKQNENSLDKCVEDIIDRRINRMARAVTNAATIIDPDRVIIFGYMFNEKSAKRFIECCKEYYPGYDEKYISASSLQPMADYIGPVAMVAKNMFFERNQND